MRVTDSDTSLLLVGWGRVWTFLLQPSTADGDSPYLSEIFLSIFSLHINKILALSTFPFHAFPALKKKYYLVLLKISTCNQITQIK